MKKLLTLLVFTFTLSAVAPTSIADIAGDGTVRAVGTSQPAYWVLFIAASTNSTTSCTTTVITGCPRVGDSSISTSRGAALVPGSGLFLPQLDPNPEKDYNLASLYTLVQTGDKLHVIYGK